MRTGHFKKFPEVVFGQPSLPLEIAFDSLYEPLARVVSFHPAAVVAGHYSKAMWPAFLSLLAALSTLPSTFDDGLGGRGPTTAGSRSHVT
jgi:hypothetical protein